jgi:hypothetical protein
MIGFPAQYLATVEELVLLVQQGLVARQGRAQPDFRAAMPGERVLVAGGRPVPGALEDRISDPGEVKEGAFVSPSGGPPPTRPGRRPDND